MKNKFTIGAIAGMSALALAVPILAQVSGAQEEQSSSSQAEVSKPGAHVGENGMQEELLAGDDAAKVTAAALTAVPGGTINRVETDAEGDVYEAHMTDVNGARVTVKFDQDFNVTKIENGPMGGHNGPDHEVEETDEADELPESEGSDN